MSMVRRSFACLSICLAACADTPVHPAEEDHQNHPPSFAHAADHSAAQNRINATIRQSTARYQQIDAAIADGYQQSSPCVPGMGYHYQKVELVDGVVDPSQPEILV